MGLYGCDVKSRVRCTLSKSPEKCFELIFSNFFFEGPILERKVVVMHWVAILHFTNIEANNWESKKMGANYNTS